MTPRKPEIAEAIATLEHEGFAQMPFDDEIVPQQRGYPGVILNIGRQRADNVLRGAAKRYLGMKVKTRTFRRPDLGQGGIVVAAPVDRADQVFAEYGEGFYD